MYNVDIVHTMRAVYTNADDVNIRAVAQHFGIEYNEQVRNIHKGVITRGRYQIVAPPAKYEKLECSISQRWLRKLKSEYITWF